MTPGTARTLIQLAVVGVVLGVTFGAGWTSQGWRLGTKLATVQKEHAEALSTAQERTRQAQAALQADKDAKADKLAGIDSEGRKTLIEAQNENERLNACVRAGTCGLRIAARFPAAAAGVSSPSKGSSVDSGAAAVLTPEAGQDYLDLRAAIATTEGVLRACQRSLGELTGQAVK